MFSLAPLRIGLLALLALPAVPGMVAVAAAGTKVLPVLNKPLADLSSIPTAPVALNLNNAFGTEPIDDQVVRFTSQFSSGSVPLAMDMAMFSNRTPVTRTNFLRYVADGSYVNSFIHRSTGSVIQGGASRFTTNGIEAVPTYPPIVNEFGVSNTLGTISMAKVPNDPNSATSQWFVSLAANATNQDPYNLDLQDGGFTVFGRVTKDTLGNAQLFGNPRVFPIFHYGGIYSDLPLWYQSIPGNPAVSDFILFPTVALAPLPAGQAGESATLTYAVVSNSNPTVATAAIQSPATLNLVPQAGQAGVVAIVVRATDSVGNTVDNSFNLTVSATDTYTTWASRTTFPNGQSAAGQNPDGDGLTNFLEYAFIGDPAVASQAQVPVAGKTGVAPAAQFMTLNFALRKFTSSLSYVVEANNQLSGSWTPVWDSASDPGFSQAQVVSAVSQADRTLVTIKDSVVLGPPLQRFLRVRVTQQ
jgi:cyclophilin family peptidyl-prolyl cis-trans isomerase